MHEDKSLEVFPLEGYGVQAVEVVPGQLVKLVDVEIAHETFLDWFRISHVSRHFLRVYWCTSRVQLTRKQGRNSYDALLEALRALAMDAQPIRLTCFPRKLERAVGEALTAVGWSLDPHSYKTVLTAVELDGWLDWGLHPGHLHHLQLPDEPSRLPAGCSHAVGKLAEAVDAIGWDMRKVKVAVDLGAAPGSWTSFLAQYADKVLAADPAAMDSSVLALPNVLHLQARAPEVLSSVFELAGDQGVDMLVSDMNMHPSEMMPIVASLLPCLRSGGLLVLTLKFAGVGRHKEEWHERLQHGLGVKFSFARLVWLLANTGCERTFIATLAR